MASSKAQFKRILKRIEKQAKALLSKKSMVDLANEAIKIVVRRTRLGFGVKTELAERFPLKSIPWSDAYKERRKKAKLDSTTRPNKSNLTFTGQLLRSIKVIEAKDGKITLAPSGNRYDTGISNQKLAQELAKQGRVFMNISQAEYNQLLRTTRKKYGDLLKKANLIK